MDSSENSTENGDSADVVDPLGAISNGGDLSQLIRNALATRTIIILTNHLRDFRGPKESTIEEICNTRYKDFVTAVDNLRSRLSDGDLSPFIRKALATGKLLVILNHLRDFCKSKESTSEEKCTTPNQGFLVAVDNLRSHLPDVEFFKPSTSNSNQSVEARNKPQDIAFAIESLQIGVMLTDVSSRADCYLSENNFDMALKCIDSIERVFINKTPSSTLNQMLEMNIPAISEHIKRIIGEEFDNCLVEIRKVSQKLGQVVINDKQSQLSVPDDGSLGFGFTALYRCYGRYQILGLADEFKKCYFEKRVFQLTSDLMSEIMSEGSSMTLLVESHRTFFSQIAGFFIVEDRVLNEGGGLINKVEVGKLWDTAVGIMCSVLKDQFSRMQTANQMLLISDYVMLLGVTLAKYEYSVGAVIDVLNKHSDEYHELLLSDCRQRIKEALAADNFERIWVPNQDEYSENVLTFQMQPSTIINMVPHRFPYIVPFSSTAPDCCRIVSSFIEDSVSFMSNAGQHDFYNVVKMYLDRLLTEVLDDALQKFIGTSISEVKHAMVVTANMFFLEGACDFFFLHAASLIGIPSSMVEICRQQSPLIKAHDAAEKMLSGLLKKEVDDYMMLIKKVKWNIDEPPQRANVYMNEVKMFLEDCCPAAQRTVPGQVLKRVWQDVLTHISETIVNFLAGASVKRFSSNAVIGIDVDIKLLESFVEAFVAPLEEDIHPEKALDKARQLVHLLLSDNPEEFMVPAIKETSYNVLDPRKVKIIAAKLKVSSERFKVLGFSGGKKTQKEKSLDSLVKRLKDAS